ERKNSPNLFLGTNLLRAQKKLDFILSDEVTDKLNLIHAQGKDLSALLKEFLNQKDQETEQKEQELSKNTREETHLPSRNYYKKAIRDFLNEKYGTKCAVSGCTKSAEEIHHKIRFGLQANNDPAYLVPLCKEHHKIAHAIDLKVVEHWKK
ncbi:MAG: HNH endonuclease signature motif containing protein, partial [Candidatus Gracilibacteria bacterium]